MRAAAGGVSGPGYGDAAPVDVVVSTGTAWPVWVATRPGQRSMREVPVAA